MDNVVERLGALRSLMAKKGIHMYYIGSEDFHGSEYVGDYFRARAWISGFTGSAGTVVVTADQAGLWTDGRYFLQAEAQLQGTGITLFKMGQEGVPTVSEYIKKEILQGQVLGFDGRTMDARMGSELAAALAAKGASLRGDVDLIGEIWPDRPAISQEPAWDLPVSLSGESRESKLERIRALVKAAGADRLILTSLDDIAWLLNIRGNDVLDNPVVLSYMLLGPDTARLYASENAFKGELKDALLSCGIELAAYDSIYEDIRNLDPSLTVMYDEKVTNYAILEALPEGIKKVVRENPTLLPKAIKNPVEVEGFRRAHLKDGIALTRFMYWFKKNVGKIPMTEISVSDKMESFRKEQEGYIEPSFEPISGYADHAAIIHYSADEESNKMIEAKGMLLMDTGAQYMDGTTDITRTFVAGPLTEEEKRAYTMVLRSNLNLGGVRFRYGCTGYNLDYVAREPFWLEGLDYNHGTGHGVGHVLNVHESPNGFRWRAMPGRNEGAIFEEGMITSNEPGFYEDGKYGVRHENLMVCLKGEKTKYGQFMYFDTLTLVPMDLDGVDVSMMTEREKKLLNDYHQKIYDMVGPHLNEEERSWLKIATRAI